MSEDNKPQEPRQQEQAQAQTQAQQGGQAQDGQAQGQPAQAGQPGQAQQGAQGAQEAPELTPEEELAQLRAENAELRDKLLRAVADMENLRKRLEREKDEAVKYAASTFARDMLNVCDNLSRAIESVPAEKRASADDLLKSLLDGVEMTLKDLLNTFERHQIRRIPAHGEKFDPNVHEAMFEVEDTDAETGTVVQVIQEGYTHHDRVLRPARVGVARKNDK